MRVMRQVLGQTRSVLWLFVLFCMLACPVAGYAEGPPDISGKELTNVKGLSEEEGQRIYFGTGMDGSRISGVEKAVLANRAYTFVATGTPNAEWLMVLRYFWDTGLPQHPQDAEREILRNYRGFNTSMVFWSFKTCVFKNKVYLFFATEYGEDKQNGLEDGTIYSMSGVPVGGDKINPGPLHFQGEPEIAAALKKKLVVSSGIKNHRWICAAKVINGKMVLFYAVNSWPHVYPYIYTWCYVETEDGEHWSRPRMLRRAENTFPQSAVTFLASNEEDTKQPATERIMLAYSRFTGNGTGKPEIVFFDGEKLYGKKELPGDTQNITLALGTVKGAGSDRQTIQLWCTESGPGHQKPIYHAEYVPKGPGGDQGSFVRSPIWTLIEQPGYWTARTDPWPGFDHASVRFWTPERWLVAWNVGTVFDTFDPSGQKMQQYLDLTFHQRWVYYFLAGSFPYIKTLRYTSDVMKRDGEDTVLNTAEAYQGKDDFWKNLWVLLGVIEGPPPVPANGHTLKELGSMFSRATVGKSKSETFAQTFTAQESLQVGMSFGNPLAPLGAYGSFAIGPQFMQQRASSETLSNSFDISVTIDTTSRPASADVGQLVIMKPTITNKKYKVFGWDGKHQVGPGYNALSITKSRLSFEPYSLTSPNKNWYSAGMTPRFLTTDYAGWQSFRPPLNDPDYKGFTADGVLQAGMGTSGSTISLQKDGSRNETNSYGFSVQGDLSIMLKVLSIDIAVSGSFDWAFTTASTFNDHVQWFLDLPAIEGPTPGINRIRVQPFYLQATTTGPHAWWIPKHFRDRKVEPWCITYHVVETIPEKPASSQEWEVEAVAGKAAALTVSVPNGGGAVRSQALGGAPVKRSKHFPVTIGNTIDLTAVANPGYVFHKWVFGSSEAMRHSSSTQTQTWLVMKQGGVASTVSAVFKEVLPEVTINLDDFQPGNDFIKIKDAYLDKALLSFDPDKDRLAVLVNQYRFSCDSRPGVWAKSGNAYVYSSKDPGQFRLQLDLDAGTWSFHTYTGDIHRSLKDAAEDLKLGLSLNDKNITTSYKANVKSSFQGTDPVSSKTLGIQNLDEEGIPPADVDASDSPTYFSILKLQGSYNTASADGCTLSASGEWSGLDKHDLNQLIKYGIVAFYLGEDTVFQSKASNFEYDKERGSLSYTKQIDGKLSSMMIDLKQGTWSLKMTGLTTTTMPDEIEDAYLVLYNSSPLEPGRNVGLGNKNYRTLWMGGDLLQIKRRAVLKVKGS